MGFGMEGGRNANTPPVSNPVSNPTSSRDNRDRDRGIPTLPAMPGVNTNTKTNTKTPSNSNPNSNPRNHHHALHVAASAGHNVGLLLKKKKT